MGKVFGILLVVVAIWVGMTVFTEGTERAFGGLLSRFAPATSPRELRDGRAPLERVREKAEAAREMQLGRIERQLSRTSRDDR